VNVLVWSSWVEHPIGGQERISLELALQLHQRGHHVVLVGAYDNAAELRAKIPTELPYYFFDLHRRRMKPHLAAFRLLQGVAQKHAIDVISGHGNIFAPAAASWRCRLPFIWTIHGVGPINGGLISTFKSVALWRLVISTGTHIVAVSEADAQMIREHCRRLRPEALHLIHNGAISEMSLREAPLAQMGPPWHIGYIGRVSGGKRPLDLVEVARQLEGTLDYRVHVFGNGPLTPALRESIQRHHLQERFVLHGYWDKGPDGMVKPIHLLVHPSQREGFGSTLLEAQLAGRPVVAYSVGGNPESIAHGVTGWLVPLGDTKGLADGIRKITGPEYPAFAANARQRAIKEFSMRRMIEQYEELFREVCASR
jgi:glycosyltransferase involved in cell wall biosynthesis